MFRATSSWDQMVEGELHRLTTALAKRGLMSREAERLVAGGQMSSSVMLPPQTLRVTRARCQVLPLDRQSFARLGREDTVELIARADVELGGDLMDQPTGGPLNKRAPISGSERPAPASRTICDSWVRSVSA
jgi:hypothetical protein